MKKILIFVISLIICSVGKVQASLYQISPDEEESENGGIVITMDDLIKGVTFNQENRLIVGESTYNAKRIFPIKANESIVVGNVDNGKRPYQGLNETAFPFVSFYKGENLIFSKVFEESYGSFEDVCVTPFGFAVIGYFEKTPVNNEAVCYEFSVDGEVLRKMVLTGTGEDFGLKIDYDDGYLFASIKTSSNDEDYYFSSGNKVCFAVINYKTFELFGMKPTIEDSKTVYNIYYDKEYVYASLVNNYNHKIIKYTKDGEAVNFYEFDNLIRCNMKMALLKDKIIYYEEKAESDQINYYVLDYNFDSLEKGVYSFSEANHKIDSVVFKYENDLLLVGATMSPIYNALKRQEVIKILNDDFTTAKSFKKEIVKKANIVDLYARDGLICLNSSFVENYQYIIRRTDVAFIEASSYKEQSKKYCKYGYNLLINEKIVETKRLDFVDVEKYQTVDVKEIYDTYGLAVVVPVKYVCLPQMNVKDGETYDLNLKLEFNGKGYLNGKEVKSGYTINQIGIYTLKIANNYDEATSCSFIVKDLGIKGENDLQDNSVELIRSITEESKNDGDINTIDYKIDYVQENTNYFFIIIIMGVLGIASGFLIFLYLRKKHHVI